jgi:hypothetical protein
MDPQGRAVQISDPVGASQLRQAGNEITRANNGIRKANAVIHELTAERNDYYTRMLEQCKQVEFLEQKAQILDNWRNYRGELINDHLIPVLESTNADRAAYEATARKLIEESTTAPRPEERPFANSITAVDAFAVEVRDKTLAAEPMRSAANGEATKIGQKHGIKIPENTKFF